MVPRSGNPDCQPHVNSRRRKGRKQQTLQTQPGPKSKTLRRKSGAQKGDREAEGLLEVSRGCGHSEAEVLQVEMVRKNCSAEV